MSVQKMEYVDKSFGHFNEAPEGWREITPEEFARDPWWTWGHEYYEFRQINRYADGTPVDGPMISARMFWMRDGTGVAMEQDYWGEKIRYYRFGCDHDYRVVGQAECKERGIDHWGMHCRVSECRKCGHLYSVDTSG